ncbi:hypothetical protein DPMN_073904 [Dreissena polymorpha]|uniref:Uncharacterized protein n=1 Tax=Dreissena polymorpha TaxID=45954 RepID=A0A9D4BL30_DREPO|nr:hypothetical protein DPMN_073904 [Dreissena polymorpha]
MMDMLLHRLLSLVIATIIDKSSSQLIETNHVFQLLSVHGDPYALTSNPYAPALV